MFEQTFVDGTGKTNKGWSVILSFGGQMVAIGRWTITILSSTLCAARSLIRASSESLITMRSISNRSLSQVGDLQGRGPQCIRCSA